ncbi:hypothetical protein Lal_00043212, partial [Lupinus albus]
MVNLHLRQNPRVDEGFSLKRDTCRSSDVEAVATTKMVGFSLKRDPSRSSETPGAQARPPRSSEIQGHFWGLFSRKFWGFGHLHPINPEIDRTYHRLVRQSRNLPFHSVPDSVSDSDSISNSIPVSVHSVQYTDFVHSVALSDSEHSENSVYYENMAQPPTPPGPRHLHPINPEIDRTYHRLVRQSRNLPFHSVPDSVSDSDSISNSIPVSVHSVQYTDFVHSVALSDSEHSENSVYYENMAQPPTPPGP